MFTLRRKPNAKLLDIPNHLFVEYLTPKDLIRLSRTSKTIHAWCDVLNNPFWIACLLADRQSGLTPTQAATLFFAEPLSRLPIYVYLGDLGQQHLRNHLNALPHISQEQIVQYEKLVLRHDISIIDAIPLVQMISPEMTVEKISDLLTLKKTRDEITHHAGVVHLKLLYRSEAATYYKWAAFGLSCFLLSTAFYAMSQASEQQLEPALAAYSGNIPYTPDEASSLTLWDYCSAMKSSYDISNCQQINNLYFYGFIKELCGSLLLTSSAVCFFMMALKFYLHCFIEEAYIQSKILMHYLLPEILRRFLPVTHALTQPLLTAESVPSYDIILGIARAEYEVFFAISFVILMESLAVICYPKSTYLYHLTHHNLNKMIDKDCYAPYMNSTNTSYATDFSWRKCAAGNFTQMDYAFEPTQSIQAICKGLCQENFPWGAGPHSVSVSTLHNWMSSCAMTPPSVFILFLVSITLIAWCINSNQPPLRSYFPKLEEKRKVVAFTASLNPKELIEPLQEQRIVSANNDYVALPQDEFVDPELGNTGYLELTNSSTFYSSLTSNKPTTNRGQIPVMK